MGKVRRMGERVVITGAGSSLGRRVVARAAADPAVDTVVAIDRVDRVPGAPSTTGGAAVEHVTAALTDPELKRVFEGATAIVHLGATDQDGAATDLDGTGVAYRHPGEARHLLEHAASAGVRTVVVLSSAMVYGAWPNNPVPLTEDAPIRPDPALGFAVAAAEVERLAGESRDERNQGGGDPVTIAILRPAVAVGADRAGWLARSPWSAVGVRSGAPEPPAQFLHLDDLASALDLARRDRLDGPFNVAPDGWIPADQLRSLSGPAPRVQLPSNLAERVATMRFRAGFTATPPSVLPYTRHPWVVANDRLRAAGWVPSHTNEEAFVEADDGGPLAALNPKRRQLLAFGVVGAAGALLLGAVVALVRRARR
jgi:nucleoside-diphosphate-sugar epimerase